MSTAFMGTNSYMRWIIASEYYDGAMAGIGERTSDNSLVWFRVVAWDDEQWQRVFAVARIDHGVVAILQNCLERVEPRRKPFWLPGPATDSPDARAAWNDIVGSALRSSDWWLAEGHDLMDAATEYVVASTSVPSIVANAKAGLVLNISGEALAADFLRRFEGGV